MEHTAYTELVVREKIFEGDGEQIVDCDVMVPDYLPEVMKILRVDACPAIDEVKCQKGEALVRGSVEICLLYLPERGDGVKCLRHTAYFDKSFELPGANENTVVLADVTNKFINCRLQSSQKLNFSVGLVIHVSARNNKELKCVKPERTDGVEVKFANMPTGELIGMGSTRFTIEEDLEIASSKEAAAQLLKCDVRIGNRQEKIIANKIIIKAVAYFCFLYETVSGAVETARFEIPVSHILELSGVDDDCVCTISYAVTGKEYHLQDDYEGEARTINASVEVCVTVCACRNQNVAFVQDAYTTRCESSLVKQDVVFEQLCPEITSEITIKESMESENGVSAILDTAVSPFVPEVKCEGKRIFINSTADVFLLIRNGEGECESLERQLPAQFVIDRDDCCEGCDMRFVVEATDIVATIAGEGTIQLKLTLCARGTLWKRETVSVVCDITLNPEKPLPRRKGTLVLYYPDQEESFWEIAKRYCASADRIREVNHCEGDICKERMLMVPKL